MRHVIKSIVNGLTLRGGIGALVASAALSALPAAALAGHHDRDDRGGFRVDVDVPVVVHDDASPPMIRERETRVWVEPVYRTVPDRQWVEPTFQTVTERVWVAPATTTQSCQVLVPDRYETRDVVRYEWGHRRIYRETVLVEPAHYEDRPGQVVVTPGHYEDVQRQQLVCDGHWQQIDRQELVAPGHWETRIDQTAYRPMEDSGVRLELRWPFH